MTNVQKTGNKVLVILGPTSSGKTKWAVKLAQRFNGEIVSADSRQVYIGMDVGTGKDLGEYVVRMTNSKYQMTNKISNVKFKTNPTFKIPASLADGQNLKYNPELRTTNYELRTIPYHLIDIVKPNTNFNLAKYQKLALKAINDILKRGKLPIIVGGTGLYIQSLIDNYDLPKGKPDFKLRKKLQKKSLTELLRELKSKDLYSYNKVDKKNKRRVERALEYFLTTGTSFFKKHNKKKSDLNFLIIGIKVDQENLHKRIYQRLIHRLEKEGMIEEVKKLHNEGVGWKKLESFGLEYKWISWFLRKKIDYDKMVQGLLKDICHFAKKQMTWFKRERRVNWTSNFLEVLTIAKLFLKRR